MTKAKVAFCADIHIANHRRFGQPSRGLVAPVNTRCADTLAVLRAAKREAEKQGCEAMVILGDVFDTSNPSPQLVAECQAALVSTSMEVHIMIGNHDQVSDQPGDHGLISMDGWKNLRVYDKPEVLYLEGWQVHLVPYRPGRADDYLLDMLTELLEGTDKPGPGVDRILGLHLGLRTKDTSPWLQNSHDSIDAASLPRHLYQQVIAGNWHGREQVMKNVIQCGALVPTGFDNPGMTGYGSLVVYSEEGCVAAELPGPRFMRGTGLHDTKSMLQRISEHSSGYPIYVSVRCAPAEREEVAELLDLYSSFPFEILTDKAAAEDAARSAATVAAYASTDSLQAAVSAYVDKMPLPDGVERGQVKALALDYIAGAAV